MHDLDAKRLLFATVGRDNQTVLDFAADLKAHGGEPAEVRHVCMDMSAAYAKGAAQALPAAAIGYDRFHGGRRLARLQASTCAPGSAGGPSKASQRAMAGRRRCTPPRAMR